MKSLRRGLILSLFAVCLFIVVVHGVSAQQNDNVIKRAAQLLKNYKPEVTKAEQPSVTPNEAWRLQEEKRKAQFRKNTTGINIPLTSAQEKLIKQIQESGKRKSEQQIRRDLELRRDEEKSTGNDIQARLLKRGIRSAVPLTHEEKKERSIAFAREQQQTSGIVHRETPTPEQLQTQYAADPEMQRIGRNAVNSTSTGVISGYVFNDENHNSVWDDSEGGVEGLTAVVYRYHNGANFHATTDSNGYYSISGLPDNEYYYVYFESFAGFYLTFNGGDKSVYLPPQDTVKNINYGVWKIPYRSVSGTVFNDINHNGVRDSSEEGIAGWEVKLQGSYSGNIFSVFTDSLGYYHFDSIRSVEYFSLFDVDQPRWLQTYPYSGYYSIYMFDTSNTDMDFGYWFLPPYSITGMKFNDANGNGQFDVDEEGIPGWKIYAYNYGTGQTKELVTDTLGMYSLYDSGSVTSYVVTEQNIDGWLTTYPWQSQSAYHSFSVAGDTIENVNFGNWQVPLSSIRGTAYNDKNNSGTRDENEPGLHGWTITLIKNNISSGGGALRYSATVPTGVETLMTVTDENGYYTFDSLVWAANYQVNISLPLDWIASNPGSGWSFFLAGDTVENIHFGNYLPPQLPLRVNVMPSNATSSTYANAVAGKPLTVWGNIHGGYSPMKYKLEYGDGQFDSGIVTNRRFIGFDHVFSTAGPKTMQLTVWDDSGAVESDAAVIQVFPVASQQIRTNMAIEKGLLYLYLTQYPDGSWTDASEFAASTGAAILSFEENGHTHDNDIEKDIYAEYVDLGMKYLFDRVTMQYIDNQPAGNPDTDNDGIGAFISNNTYANGIANLAILGAHTSAAAAQADTIRTGTYTGQSFYDYAVDMVNQWAYSQTDAGYYGRGGWRYSVSTPNDGSQDNSTTQWAALDLEAAQNTWGIAIPQFVKDELVLTLIETQNSNGGFGYETADYWLNITKTAAAIGSYSLLGVSTSLPAISNAINFINSQWSYSGTDDYGWDQPLSGNTYAMYAVAKGMRLLNNRAGEQFIGAHDWYAEYVTHLLDNPTWKQKSDGSFPRSDNAPGGYMGDGLNSSLAILVLTRGVVLPPPVAVISPLSGLPPNVSFELDGSGCFHQDPEKTVVEYLWDFNADDGIDWEHPDASGQRPSNPGYTSPGTYTIVLRVKDNSDPPMYSTTSITITISTDQNPPIAVAIPPVRGRSYAAKVGEPILLDGRSSFDPDYPADSVIAYSWDLNGDGLYGDASTDTITVTFDVEHQGLVGLRVYDTHGDSSSNTAYITIVASRKDIFVESFYVVTDSLFPAGTITCTAVIKNDDESNMGVSHVAVKFFDNDPLTTGNQVGDSYFVDLPVGDDTTLQVVIPLPDVATASTRQFYVSLDPSNQIAEWDEQNNIVGSKSDLSVLQFNLSNETVNIGDTLTLSGAFHNSHEATVELHHMLVRFYARHEDNTEEQLGGDAYIDVPANGSDSVTMSCVVPIHWSSGTVHIVAKVDAENRITETDEDNNTSELELTVDVPPSHIVIEKSCLNFSTVEQDEERTVELQVTNEGVGKLFIDSLFTTHEAFTVSGGTSMVLPGQTITLEIAFEPEDEGVMEAELWFYTSDGNHSVALFGHSAQLHTEGHSQTFKGRADVSGIQADEGSVVGAFKLDGTLIVSTTVDDIDDGSNYRISLWEGQSGITAGDTIIFKVWTDECIWMNDRYCEPSLVFQPDSYTDTTFVLHRIDAQNERSQSIQLFAGYNAVSWNVIPENESVQSVFAGILSTGKVKILLDFINDGMNMPRFDYYIPALGQYNTFLTTTMRKGYFVNLDSNVEPETLTVTGSPVCATIPIEVYQGYNFVSYLPEYPESTHYALESLIGKNFKITLDFINNGTGNGWFNFYPFGGLDMMQPGKGYFVGMYSSGILQYPEVNSIPVASARNMNGKGEVTSLAGSKIPQAVFAYGKDVTLSGVLIPKGTEIRAVDMNGVVCGKAQFAADGIFGLPIYADDPSTDEDEGASTQEYVSLYIGNNLISNQVQWTEFGDVHEVSGEQHVTGLGNPAGIPEHFGLSQNYPNPFNPTTQIAYQLPVASRVTLKIFDILGREVASLIDGVQDAGYKSKQFDATRIPNGIYYYRIEAISVTNPDNSYTEVKKMVLLK